MAVLFSVLVVAVLVVAEPRMVVLVEPGVHMRQGEAVLRTRLEHRVTLVVAMAEVAVLEPAEVAVALQVAQAEYQGVEVVAAEPLQVVPVAQVGQAAEAR